MVLKGLVIATDGTPIDLPSTRCASTATHPNGVEVARVAAATLASRRHRYFHHRPPLPHRPDRGRSMITSVLIANRGEIARRIIRTARAQGIRSIAVYSDIDADLPFVAEADESVQLPGEGATAYRDIDAILKIAADTGAEAIHPGYGFLSENAEFAAAVTAAGLIWVGPSAEVISTMGDKIAARQAAIDAGVPVVPGSEALSSVEQAVVRGRPDRLSGHGQGRRRWRRNGNGRRRRRLDDRRRPSRGCRE